MILRRLSFSTVGHSVGPTQEEADFSRWTRLYGLTSPFLASARTFNTLASSLAKLYYKISRFSLYPKSASDVWTEKTGYRKKIRPLWRGHTPKRDVNIPWKRGMLLWDILVCHNPIAFTEGGGCKNLLQIASHTTKPASLRPKNRAVWTQPATNKSRLRSSLGNPRWVGWLDENTDTTLMFGQLACSWSQQMASLA